MNEKKPIFRIIRGLPGSGKSTLARQFGAVMFESDMALHFRDEYCWTPENLDNAINWVVRMVEINVLFKHDITICGVFTRPKNFMKHIEKALENGYEVQVIRCVANYGNIHDVPEESLDRMKRTFLPYEGEVIYDSTTINFL